MIALIDFDSALYIAGSDKVEKDEDGNKTVIEKTEELAIEQIHSIIDETVRNVSADGYILFLTSGKNFRYGVDPQYKANRIGTEPPRLMRFCKDYVRQLPGVMDCTTVEADDAVVICKNALAKPGVVQQSIICSPDKDIIKCIVGQHYNYRTLEFVSTDLAEAEYNFWTSVITGDSSDGIKGIPKSGPAAAKKLFEANVGKPYRDVCLNAYIDYCMNEREGIDMFYKNYMLLKLLERPDYGFVVPEPYMLPVKELF